MPGRFCLCKKFFWRAVTGYLWRVFTVLDAGDQGFGLFIAVLVLPVLLAERFKKRREKTIRRLLRRQGAVKKNSALRA